MSTQLVDLTAGSSPNLEVMGSGADERRQWFAVFTRSHHEKRVAQYYAEREIEHLLPISRMVRQWSHYRKVTVEMPLFPNYIFARISRRERTAALKVPGALSLVSQNSIPAALPDDEIESLREGLKMRNASPHPYLVAGARVRINKGALAGREGVVLRHKNSFRVVLTLSVVMRSFAVEVDAADVDYLAG
jgi:transcription antitermination factor NusG